MPARKPLKNLDRALMHAFGGSDSYIALFEGTTLGANVRHAAIFNDAASERILQVHDIRPINLQTAAVAGTAEEFRLRRITAIPTGGTAVVPWMLDVRSPVVPATVDFQRGATGGATEDITGQDGLNYPFVIGTDEVTASSVGQTAGDLMYPFGFGIEPFRINPGGGILVKQISAGTIGAVAWMLAFSMFEDI